MLGVGDATEHKAPDAQAKYALEYYVTFFNKEVGGVGAFYGRTYRSRPL
jgi:hypothetical protein